MSVAEMPDNLVKDKKLQYLAISSFLASSVLDYQKFP